MTKRSYHPPKRAIQFLKLFCKENLAEEIEGDLVEEFARYSKKMSKIKANLWFWIMVLTFFRPFALKKFSNPLNKNRMIRRYIKVAARSFLKQKLAVGINVISLTIGLGCAILILLFIQNEWTYDQFHKNKEQLFRLNRMVYNGNNMPVDGIEGHPLPFAATLKSDFPEIEATCRIYDDINYIKAENFLAENQRYFVDSNFFELFSFSFLQGNPNVALDEMNKAVLTKDLAADIFGSAEKLGQTIMVYFDDAYYPFEVSGIIENIPPNSTLNFDIALPLQFFESLGFGKRYRDSWGISFIRTFALLKEGVDVNNLEKKTIAFCDEHFPRRTSIHNEFGEDSYYGEVFQPIGDVHFDELVESNLGEPGRKQHSFILAGIGIIILLIACINFTILAIGRSSNRFKEIGVRKVVGAFRAQLRTQFLSEAIFLSLLSLILGLGFAQIFLPQFNSLSNRSLDLLMLLKPIPIGLILGFTLLSGLLAGIYPAFLLSKYEPVKSMSSRFKLGSTNLFTKSLVTLQFILSIVLVIVTLVMLEQLRFMKNRDLGFDQEMLLVIEKQGQDSEEFISTYKNELSPRSDVEQITGTNPAFTHGAFSSNFEFEGKNIDYYITFIETDYLETMGIDLVAGRNFRPGSSMDSTQHILVNQAFVEELGWEDAIGKKVRGLSNAGYDEPIIIGVTNNFHFQSLEHSITPMWMALSGPSDLDDLVIKVHPSNVKNVLRKAEEVWTEKMATEYPFTYSFLDEDMASLYAAEERWGRIITISGIFTLVIAFLGMYGLIAMSVVGRSKEMSIRKVLGANLKTIALTLAGPFAKMVILAIFIAAPVAWYFSVQWLNNFAFHIPFRPGLVIIAFLIIWALFIAATGYHIWRSLRIDPVKFLKTE